MQQRTLEERVARLEQQMLERRDLPSRVKKLESQFLQLRKEMRDEFSAMRTAIKAADDETRIFMRILYEDVLARLEAIGESDGPDS